MRLMITITDEEYALLKAYAAAKRKYEVGKGFTVDKAINEMTSIGIDAISQTPIFDNEGRLVEWNQEYNYKEADRKIYRKY